MALYERWYLQYNDAKDVGEDSFVTVKKNILPGTKVWVQKHPKAKALKLPVQKVPKGKAVLFGKKTVAIKSKTNQKKNEKEGVDTARWQLVPVLSRSRDNITVKISTGFRVINLKDSKDILPANDALSADMTEMQYVHKPAILYNLKMRALKCDAYTYIGNVLISINPLRDVDSGLIFEPGNSEFWPPHPRTVAERAFQKMAFSSAQERRLMQYDEHSRRTTKFAPTKKSLLDKDSKFAQQYGLVNQSIVISGESGSGKTEASKRVLSQLVEREGYGDEFSDDDDPGVFDFQDNLIGTDPILESFGNARTKRNPNSSRFGKFLQLWYDPPTYDGEDDYMDNDDSFFIEEATITTYLLERSRVTYQEKGEGNFRVFYQLLTAPNDAMQKHLGFTQAGRCFRYLNNEFNRNDHDRIGYRDLRIALSMVKINFKARHLFEIVAAVLHIGNICFKAEDTSEGAVAAIDDPFINIDMGGKARRNAREKRTRQNRRIQSVADAGADMRDAGSRIARRRKQTAGTRRSVASNISGGTVNSQVSLQTIIRRHDTTMAEKNMYSPIRTACSLLKISHERFEKMLTQTQVRIAGGERITKRITVEQAIKRRDAIAKHIYGLLFDFIVQQLNGTLKREGNTERIQRKPFIGILDVFGFEHFEKNSFEQLLINYTNEVLLQLFAKEILVGESRIYKDEGLIILEDELDGVADAMQAYDETLSLFEGHALGSRKYPGILQTIDSQQRVPKASDSKLLSELQKQFGNHNHFVKPHPSKRDRCFIVKHYASIVTYQISGFLLKNDQSLPSDLEVIFTSSRHRAFRGLPVSHLPADQARLSVRRSAKRKSTASANGKKVRNDTRDKRRNKRISKLRHSVGRNKNRGNKKNQTVCKQFSKQIDELKHTLTQTACSYIRCVKPNPYLVPPPPIVKASGDEDRQDSRQQSRLLRTKTKQAAMRELEHRKLTFVASKKNNAHRNYFDEDYISMQLKNLGVYDCVNVLKAGLPTRIPYPTFLMTYSNMITLDDIVFYKNRSHEFQQRTFVAALMKSYDIDANTYKLGKSKIFFKSGKLEDVKNILSAGGTGGQVNKKQKQRYLRHFNRYYCKKLWRVCIAKTQVAQYFLDDLYVIRAVLLLQKEFRKFLEHRKESIKIKQIKAAVTIQCAYRVLVAKRIYTNLVAEHLQNNINLDEFGSTSRGNSKVPTELGTHWEELSMNEPEYDKESVEILSDVSQIGEFNALRTNLKSYFDRRTGYNKKTLIFDKDLGDKYRTMKSNTGKTVFNAHRNDSDWSQLEDDLMLFEGGDVDKRLYPRGRATVQDGEQENLQDFNDSSSDPYSSDGYDDDEVDLGGSDYGDTEMIGTFNSDESAMGGTVKTQGTGSKADGTVDDMDIFGSEDLSTRRGTKATLMKNLSKNKRTIKAGRASLASKKSGKSKETKGEAKKSTKKRASKLKLEGKSKTNLPKVRRVSNIVAAPYTKTPGARPVNRLNPKKSKFWEKREQTGGDKPLPPWRVKLRKVKQPTFKEAKETSKEKKQEEPIDLNEGGIAARIAKFGGSTLKRNKP